MPHCLLLKMAKQSRESLHDLGAPGEEGRTHSRIFCVLHDAQGVEAGTLMEKSEAISTNAERVSKTGKRGHRR